MTRMRNMLPTIMITLLVFASLLVAASCTDAWRGKLTALGDSAHIQCWSGGDLIFDGRSTGKVSSEKNSDGYFFRDARDGLFKEVSGNCVISYGDGAP